MKIVSFRDLLIWQKSMQLVNNVYAITKSFPKDEMFGLTSQIRRAAIAMPASIAEGSRRFHKKTLGIFYE